METNSASNVALASIPHVYSYHLGTHSAAWHGTEKTLLRLLLHNHGNVFTEALPRNAFSKSVTIYKRKNFNNEKTSTANRQKYLSLFTLNISLFGI
jgi:hypothetical protein